MFYGEFSPLKHFCTLTVKQPAIGNGSYLPPLGISKTMKQMNSNIIILQFLILFFSIGSYGQEIDNGLRLNFNLGPTYSNMIGKGIIENSWINGYPPDCYTNGSASDNFILGKKIGMGIIKDINKTFSFGIDLNYEEKGCRIPITYISYLTEINGSLERIRKYVNEKSNIKLKYLIIPMTLETKFKIFYIQTGFYSGILLDADDYGTIRIDNQELGFERDKDGRYFLFDIGILFGTGIIIPISDKNTLKFGVNGNWNVTGNDGRGMTPRYKYHWYNQSYNFEIRYERKIK